MGGSSKPATTTVNQVNSPYAPAQPHLQNILNEAQSTYASGVGAQPYGGPRVAGFGADTQSAMAQIRSLLGQGASPSVQTATGFNANLIGSGGMTPGTRSALDQLSQIGGIDNAPLQSLIAGYGPQNAVSGTATDLMGGRRDINTETDLRSLLASARSPSATETNLGGVARGDYLSNGNPYLDALIKQGATEAADAVASRFAGAGRYGSGSMGGAIAKATGDIATRTRAAAYDAERQRQAEANQAIDAQTLSRLGLGNTLLGAIGGVQGQNNQNRLAGAGLQQSQTAQQLGALGQLAGQEQFNRGLDLTKAENAVSANQNATNAALAAVGNIPMLEDQRLNPAQTLLQLGTMQDARSQAELDAERQRFEEGQRAPWERLGLYQAAALPIAQTGSQTTGTTVQTPARPSGAQEALGMGLGGISLLGKLFGQSAPAVAGGAAGPSLVSSIGSAVAPMMAMFSDERLKEDIERVGRLDNGLPVYSYRYRDGGPRQIGLLAQDVEKKRPEAVHEHESGFKMVEYGAASSKKRAA